MRWLFVISALATSAAVLAACSSTETAPATAPNEAGKGDGGVDATSAEDAVTPEREAGKDASADARLRDANGPGARDAVCSFNSDCQTALRCECDEATGCFCKPGARGTGQNGIDPCTTGNACASAVCVEGPPDSGFFCSDECAESIDCTGKLPVCTTVSFVGRICIRAPR